MIVQSSSPGVGSYNLKSSIGEARSSSILLRPKSFDTNLMDSVTDTKNYD